MFKNSAQPENQGMETKTEQLLRQASAICCRVTGRNEASDELIAEVFRHLQLETGLFDAYEDGDEHPPPGSCLH